ncbi:hypothetical protein DYQ86_17550 [Acidobacteria bacterium AB60]|nr:hypothetical protein DYQ86_17550 [Acidobacteria bacterium AB60]
MRFPYLASVSLSVCAGLVFSGCSSTSISGSGGASAAAPSVVAVGVQNNGVAPNRWQYVQFNEAMDASTINAQTFVVTDSGGKGVAGKVTYYPDLEVAGFEPSPALQENASYMATITTGVASMQGAHLAAAYSYNFTTRAAADTSPLYVATVTPAPNATCVSATTAITITFSEGVDVSTLTAANIAITGPGGAAIPAKITYNIATALATVTPTAALPSGMITVTVKNVADAAGVAMKAVYGWSFDTSCSSGSAVAYVYVSGGAGNSAAASTITAFAADANGQLAPVPGSPFSDNVGSIAVNGKYLVGSAPGPYINSYAIGMDGSLTTASQFNYGSDLGYQANNGTVCSGVGRLVFDPSGQSLYGAVGNLQCANNNAIASFAMDSSTGSLSYLGNDNVGYDSATDIAVLGNDAFAYGALNDACMYGGISSFARASNGLLTGFLTVTAPTLGPTAPPGAASAGVSQPIYRAGLTATDNTNHVAMVEYPCFSVNGKIPDQLQLATYSADASGHLATSDTYATMPATAVTAPQQLAISPDGTLLAVAGTQGVQVFHFNGASPITSFTGLLATDSIGAVAWDRHNHLYAITSNVYAANTPVSNPNKLYVFGVTNSGATAAPGSPYAVTFPGSIAVQSK